jgi:hypothetical protein
MINQWKGKLAVITGASSGIGAAVSRKLAAQGLQVVLVARRRERLETLAGQIRAGGGNAQILTADLTHEADRVRLCEQAGTADVLINNAGLGWYGFGDEMLWKTALEMLQVNVEAVVQFAQPGHCALRSDQVFPGQLHDCPPSRTDRDARSYQCSPRRAGQDRIR